MKPPKMCKLPNRFELLGITLYHRTPMKPRTKERILTIPPELEPDVSHLVTEDDTPLDNFFSEKQQRLLVESLYASHTGAWRAVHPKTGAERPFLASANVAIYYALKASPLVPDVFVALDVTAPDDWWEKYNRSYMTWEFAKEPEVVIEIVSNLKGGELSDKLDLYAHKLHVPYYIVFDPSEQYGSDILRIFQKDVNDYNRVELIKPDNREGFPLNIVLWEGEYENSFATWIRWQTHDGQLIPTGRELSQQALKQVAEVSEQLSAEKIRAEAQSRRAEAAEEQLHREREDKERLAAKLRSIGLDPDAL
jgi:Uma2 family endonuclease